MELRGRRIACVWLPRFALTIATSTDTALIGAGPPLGDSSTNRSAPDAQVSRYAALYQPGTRWQALLECSPSLEAAGVRPGLPLKEAQSRFPNATYLPCDDATLDAVATAFETIVDAL